MKMKQITAFFLALVLVLSLAACGAEKPADTTAAPDTTGTCAAHQRALTTAIKRARQIALLPYVAD